MRDNYYSKNLNSQKLFRVYQTQFPRVKQYLDAEISYVRRSLTGTERVLELGAGYGRVVKELADSCESIVGVDISQENVLLSEEYLKNNTNGKVIVMDVHNLSFKSKFDVILCLQNGLSSMSVGSPDSIIKIIDMVERGGKVYFSTYSEKFWEHRLMWFKEQTEKGLLGEIDLDKTKDGLIVCKDGFKATTYTKEELIKIGEMAGYDYKVQEVDESSMFLVIHKK